MNKISGYRRMIGHTQKTIAKELGISKQSYWMKETGKTPFTDKEKLKFKLMLKPLFPTITIDEIFFS
ncbi:helix-turn-helix transcriptional regulator [Vagococcus fluvialis]|uniref:helix-turn-helix transcriptional regulator n=1 Tax=Vagococcus fluvialis TaxID=2738 RepID=UPI001A8EC1E2|nr:hypothetical protein [Vagococcus fluvialis]MBO0479315.1 hypothetical protein [Vagococcus fluvialis]MBO0485173.1 hypothetical protein [Vagococcus fluvialis]